MSGDQLEIMALCGLEKPWPSFFLVVPVFTSLTSSLSFEVGFVLEALFNAEGPQLCHPHSDGESGPQTPPPMTLPLLCVLQLRKSLP